MAKIYTKTGDGGTTGISGGGRVPKDDPRIEAVGTLDELNCSLGVVRSLMPPGDDRQRALHRIQRELMTVMSLAATPSERREGNPVALDPEITGWCEESIDAGMAGLADRGWFVLPGGTPVAAGLQMARAVARRAERRLWTLHRMDPLPEALLHFVNRLSDLLFVMARAEMQRAGVDEELWRSFARKQHSGK